MGYCTEFTLYIRGELLPAGMTDLKIIEQFKESNDCARWAFDKYGNPSSSDVCWYVYEQDLKLFSLKFPSAIFILHGVGEEYGDIWNLYVKNGKSHKEIAKIVIKPYDEKILK